MLLLPGTVVVSVVVKLVGRTGGAAVAEELELVAVVLAGQFAEPQSRSVGQQPPPSDAGQDRYPDEHVRLSGGRVDDDVTVTVFIIVMISGVRVVVGVEVEVEILVDEELDDSDAVVGDGLGVMVVYEVTVVVEGVCVCV